MLEKILTTAKLSSENVLIEGYHGIGKSEQVKNYAKQNNMHLEILYLSHQEVGDLIGIPYIVNNTTMWTKPIWLVRMEEAAKKGQSCILFLDELNRAQRDVRQVAMQITLEKRIHEHNLPMANNLQTLIIAAINPEDDNKIDYQVDELDVALRDRFLYYKMDIDVKVWLHWARENNIIQEIIHYIAEYPDKLFYYTKENIYPTPRSWSMLSTLLKNSSSLNKQVKRVIVDGKLGKTIGSQFYRYYIDFENVIKIKDIEEFIIKNITTDQEKLIQQIQTNFLQNRPKIWISDISERLFEKYIKLKNNNIILIIFLNSIDLEILASLLEDIKNNNNKQIVKLLNMEGGKELVEKISDKIDFGV